MYNQKFKELNELFHVQTAAKMCVCVCVIGYYVIITIIGTVKQGHKNILYIIF